MHAHDIMQSNFILILEGKDNWFVKDWYITNNIRFFEQMNIFVMTNS